MSRELMVRQAHHERGLDQKRIFAASCTFLGSPAPMPGAPLPFRVFVRSPKVVELASDVAGFAQLSVLNTLKISQRSCSDEPPLNLVVLNTEMSTVLNDGP